MQTTQYWPLHAYSVQLYPCSKFKSFSSNLTFEVFKFFYMVFKVDKKFHFIHIKWLVEFYDEAKCYVISNLHNPCSCINKLVSFILFNTIYSDINRSMIINMTMTYRTRIINEIIFLGWIRSMYNTFKASSSIQCGVIFENIKVRPLNLNF